jgi:hypothetical protein
MTKPVYIAIVVAGLTLMTAGVVVDLTHSVKGLGSLLVGFGVLINTICIVKQPRS